MSRFIRGAIASAAAVAFAVLLPAATALAAPAVAGHSPASTNHGVLGHGQRTGSGSVARYVPPRGHPQGCPFGDFCSYDSGGGADLCLATPGDETSWGICANV